MQLPHRRVMTVPDSAVSLSLHSADPRSTPDALRGLREGDSIEPRDLEAIVPGIPSTPCQFKAASDALPYHTLTTITDGVVVVFSLDCKIEPDCAAAEARLRGTQARLVVTMCCRPM